ncbi:uncharacterized protein Bfra_008411 [Botrytis fragariae]|uniref:Uncharacterized protein n=1 Tax=Botrytis fragariae TaxID=1964551 RepID=A0A8H6EI47_9HELO|nr:uncharacterized protein Bfra_008411 [Botrytis fragariae]KAF5873134.1 hypothetical protein Bfra_008411 [Botrytis fragariae]
MGMMVLWLRKDKGFISCCDTFGEKKRRRRSKSGFSNSFGGKFKHKVDVDASANVHANASQANGKVQIHALTDIHLSQP